MKKDKKTKIDEKIHPWKKYIPKEKVDKKQRVKADRVFWKRTRAALSLLNRAQTVNRRAKKEEFQLNDKKRIALYQKKYENLKKSMRLIKNYNLPIKVRYNYNEHRKYIPNHCYVIDYNNNYYLLPSVTFSTEAFVSQKTSVSFHMFNPSFIRNINLGKIKANRKEVKIKGKKVKAYLMPLHKTLNFIKRGKIE